MPVIFKIFQFTCSTANVNSKKENIVVNSDSRISDNLQWPDRRNVIKHDSSSVLQEFVRTNVQTFTRCSDDHCVSTIFQNLETSTDST